MTLLSDDTSFFGTIVPTVYIKNVTLENSAAASDINNDRINAHTNPSATNLQNSLDIGSSSTVPGSAFVETAGNNDLKVTVDFLLKECLGNSFTEITSTWSDELNLQNYTDIYMYLLSDSLFAKAAQFDPSLAYDSSIERIMAAVYYLAKQDLLTANEINTCTSIGFLQSSFNKPFSDNGFGIQLTPDQVKEAFDNGLMNSFVATEYINLGDAMQNGTGINYGNLSQLTQYAEVDEDGKSVVNYQFTKIFECEQSNLDFLSLVVAPLLNTHALGTAYNLDLDFLGTAQTSTPFGKIKVQNILENGTVSSKSTVYYLSDDMSVWTGHIHKPDIDSNILMTGKTSTPDSRKVVAKTVNNSTVQDFRIIDRVAQLKFDLSFLQADKVALAEAYKYTRDKTDVLKQPAYFSKNYISRGVEGSAKFLFGMDFYSFIREQTTFGAAFLPEEVDVSNMQVARTAVKIANIKIKRRRVDVVPQSNRLGTYNAQEIPFKTGYLGEPHIDSEEIIKDVVIGKQADSFQNKLSLNASAPLGSSNTLEVVNFHLPENGALTNLGFEFFTGKDIDAIALTDGNYQYGVEMEVLDLTNTYITNKIAGLIEAYRTMMGYYNFCKIPGKQYNINSGRFRAVLNNYYTANGQKPWLTGINLLTNAIQVFKDKSEPFDMELFRTQLELICHPATGSPKGVETVLKLILNTATKLAEIVGTQLNFATISQVASLINADGTPNPDFNKPIDNGTLLATEPDKRTIKVEYYFDDSFSTEVPKRYGYDYLTPTGDSITAPFGGQGLATMQGESFNTRVDLETLKYFENTNPENFEITDPTNGKVYNAGDAALTSLFSYLTPASVNLGKGASKPFLVNTADTGDGVNPSTFPRFSLLPYNNAMEQDKYLFNKKAFTYIATRIMNYNSNATLPVYETTTTSDKTLLSGYENTVKFYTQQILANKNCVSVVEGQDPQTNEPAGIGGGGLFLSDYFGKEIDEADKLIDNQVTLNDLTINAPASISYKGGAENTLFLTFIYGFSAQNYGIASTKAPAPVVEGKQEVTFDFNFFQIGVDNPNKTYIDGAINTKLVGTPVGPNPTGQAPIIVQNEIKKLPNQIKSILLQYNSKSQVKHKWDSQTEKNSNNPYYKASIAINYRNIKRVEYLAGFDYGKPPVVMGLGTIPSSMPLIDTQNWKKLTPAIYESSIGKTLFCRLRTYEEKDYGIVPMESLNMPVFDEFFLLEPSEYQVAGTTVLASPIEFDSSNAGEGLVTQGAISSLLSNQDSPEYHDDAIPIRSLNRKELEAIRKTLLRG
jgi:hypothetical protein